MVCCEYFITILNFFKKNIQNFQKTLDKPLKMFYNKSTQNEEEEDSTMLYNADQSARMPCASSTAFSACAWNGAISGIAMAMSFFVIFAPVSVGVIDYVTFVIFSVVVLVVWGVLVAVAKRLKRQRKRIEYFPTSV